jgi:hypothetical protein
MKYGLIIYKDTFNLGDDIQSYADERFLPQVDYIIDREKLDTFCSDEGEKVSIIMGGWYLYKHLNWPPSPFIKPLPISMHFDTFYSKVAGEKITRNFVFEEYGATWLIENGPIGCRDEGTKKLLEGYGIPAYFSGCITLTIDPFENVEKHNKIILVDVPKDVREYAIKNSNKECIETSHSVKMSTLDWVTRKQLVERQLKLYQGAALVITTRLHAALPCLALGVPVLFIKERWSLNRTGTWLNYLNYTSAEELLSGECSYDINNPLSNPEKYKEIRDKLINSCERYINNCENSEIEYLDKTMYLDCIKRVDRLKKLMLLRVDKYERELNNH